jgi:hypothetical protein
MGFPWFLWRWAYFLALGLGPEAAADAGNAAGWADVVVTRGMMMIGGVGGTA